MMCGTAHRDINSAISKRSAKSVVATVDQTLGAPDEANLGAEVTKLARWVCDELCYTVFEPSSKNR